MATYSQNMDRIRNSGVYGSTVRTAIADAIEQADEIVEQRVSAIQDVVDDMQEVVDSQVLYLEPVQKGTTNQYTLQIIERSGS